MILHEMGWAEQLTFSVGMSKLLIARSAISDHAINAMLVLVGIRFAFLLLILYHGCIYFVNKLP